jgi:predicted regulator of Ras-like GTPase activity (Roadblock/LC7/MglB family)
MLTGSAQAQDFVRKLTGFVAGTTGVLHAVAVSPEGLLLSRSESSSRSDADRLAAITSGLTSLAGGAARSYRLGIPSKVIIEFALGHLLVSAIGQGAMLGVVAARDADVGVVAYEMALFSGQAGPGLTPAIMAELKNSAE